jgi:cysteine desulfurase
MPTRAGIYLDANAGASLKPRVVLALKSLFEAPGTLVPNPSSIHAHGRVAKRLAAEAREKVAHSLGKSTDSEQLIATSGGTEANQLAIRSALEPKLLAGEKVHWVTTPVEHDSCLQMVEWLEARGGKVSYLPVDSNGVPLLGESVLVEIVRPETALISIVWVNNETGAVSPIEGLKSKLAGTKSPRALVHLDAAQVWGKKPLDVEKTGADYVTVSAHKIGGLAGTGFLWIGRGVPLSSSILGKQEKGRRGGTENLAGLVAAGAAAEEIDPIAWEARVKPSRDFLESEILAQIPSAKVNGGGAIRIANTLNLSFDGVEGDSLVMALDLSGFSVSSGSACSSGVLSPSHVLLAMGRTKAQATAAIRVSIEEPLEESRALEFVQALKRVISRFKVREDHLQASADSLRT